MLTFLDELANIVFLYMVFAPIWLTVVGGMIIAATRERHRLHPQCGACGYNLAGSIESATKCSECGLSFEDAGVLPVIELRRPVPWGIGVGLVVMGVIVTLWVGILIYRQMFVGISA